MWALQLLTYLAVLVLLGGIAAKIVKYAKAPMHLRWELYPIPHEQGKEGYGGSYMEEPDWWTKPRESDMVAEVRAMLEEMLLIKALWHNNRAQWYASFPFHGGLYLLIGFVVLLLIGAVLEVAGLTVAASGNVILVLLHYLTIVVGVVGLASSIFGAAYLLYRRFTDENLRQYSSPSDYFNLIFLLVVFGTAAVAWATVDPSFSALRGFVRGIITLSPVSVPALVSAEVVFVTLFMIYMPFTHMLHFVAKYFTWHQVRWDDSPNIRGSAVSGRIMANLTKPVSWSAPHIQKGKSWAEVATEENK
ncbi:MAG: respiratory nitrate reductase subunit gamma [Dehalococcoidales bacterium]|nr:respiratory nitrate reductase subunit gamma [Dehalococcoidales bacterium]